MHRYCARSMNYLILLSCLQQIFNYRAEIVTYPHACCNTHIHTQCSQCFHLPHFANESIIAILKYCPKTSVSLMYGKNIARLVDYSGIFQKEGERERDISGFYTRNARCSTKLSSRDVCPLLLLRQSN